MSNILNQIIAAARAKGITQKALAASINMSVEGFSRAKKRGDMRLSDIDVIAAATGFRVCLVDAPADIVDISNVPVARKCEQLGFTFPYDWSFGEMTDDLIIHKVLDRFIFHDVVVACGRFGLDRVLEAFKAMELGEAAKASGLRSLDNIRRAM